MEDGLICETSMCPTAMRQGHPWSAASLTTNADFAVMTKKERDRHLNSQEHGEVRDDHTLGPDTSGYRRHVPMLVIRTPNCLEDVSQGPTVSQDGTTGKSVTSCHAMMAAMSCMLRAHSISCTASILTCLSAWTCNWQSASIHLPAYAASMRLHYEDDGCLRHLMIQLCAGCHDICFQLCR